MRSKLAGDRSLESYFDWGHSSAGRSVLHILVVDTARAQPVLLQMR